MIDSFVYSINLSFLRKAFCFWGKPRIFLSSTFLDLIDERRTVTALLRAGGFDVVRMEEGPKLIDPSEIVAWSKRQAVRADICIFMLSYTRGTTHEVTPTYSMSYTEHELVGAILNFPICYLLDRPFYDERRLILGRSPEEGSRKLQALIEMTQAGLAGSPEELASLRHEIDRLEAEASAVDPAAADGCQRGNDEPSRAEEMRHRFAWGWGALVTDDQTGVLPDPPLTDLEWAEKFLMSSSAETKSIATAETDDQISLCMFMQRMRATGVLLRTVDSVRRLAFHTVRDTTFAADALQRARFRRLVKFFLLVVACALLLVILVL